MKNLNYAKAETCIVSWLKEYAKKAKKDGFVIGVSGGIDSAVVSTLAAKTGLSLMVLEMPIKQKSNEVGRAQKHIEWLKENFDNVRSREIDLNFNHINYAKSNVFDVLIKKINSSLGIVENGETANLAEANSRSRLRMLMLYYAGTILNALVLGTGNKIEDFGVGFFTKYGDGGVDLSPVADLTKTEVRGLGKYMGIIEEIITAAPTDGLWDDGRSDEEQLKCTYVELEWAMEYVENAEKDITSANSKLPDTDNLNDREIEVLEIYLSRHNAGQHKVNPIPVCYVGHLRD